MNTDLSFVPTDELLAEMDRRTNSLFIVFAPKNDPNAVIDHSHGSYTWIVGALTVFQQGIAKDLVETRGDATEPDDDDGSDEY